MAPASCEWGPAIEMPWIMGVLPDMFCANMGTPLTTLAWEVRELTAMKPCCITWGREGVEGLLSRVVLEVGLIPAPPDDGRMTDLTTVLDEAGILE